MLGISARRARVEGSRFAAVRLYYKPLVLLIWLGAVVMVFGGALGEAGGAVVIEEFLAGEEASFFVLSDGENALPLYIGKSINIRDRVAAHFSSDWRSETDLRLSQEIRRIEVERTAGEFGALLREISTGSGRGNSKSAGSGGCASS